MRVAATVWMRWMALVMLAAATGASAAPWLGFTQLASAPGRGVQLTARVRVKGPRLLGRIAACAGDGPCPFADARLALDVATYDPQAREETAPLAGNVTLGDGTTCTFAGDVWNVEVRGRRVRRGALRGRVSCPTFGFATMSLWVKGYRQPFGDAG